jgi:DNA-binding SARP family transcriptional activator/tetratricopeptide (TPR) repeat protein
LADIFGVLGPVVVRRGATELRIGTAKHRQLLTVLLLHNNERVSRARIIEAMWPGELPRSADNLVQKYVGELRRAIDPTGELLISAQGGYRIRVDPIHLDIQLFGQRLDRARRARRSGEPGRAAEELAAALDLWRGEPFEGVDVDRAASERTRLGERRITAMEDLAEIRLSDGDHDAVAADLALLTAAHPLRERARALHMLALCRQGRQAEALAVYAQVRHLLADELGIDPDPALSRLHEQILRADPALGRPVALVLGQAGGPPPVSQLPSDLAEFIGRVDHIEALVAALSDGSPDRPPVVISIVGSPGVGKSSLAVHVAHAVRSSYPDGQLYLELAGTSEDPRPPADVLAEVLRALDVTGAAVPETLHERAALYRSLLADRRMLIVLDDAAHAGQVRQLLPSTGGCATVVTSRNLLSELPSTRHVDLDVFTPEEAGELLATTVGAERVAREPDQATAILAACGHLPLAIRIAGAKLVGRRAWSLRVLRERLDERRRLDELRIGDLGVQASFDLSMRQLPVAAARALCLLALQGPHTWPGWVVAPLLDRSGADDVLDLLVDSSLVRLVGTDALGQPRYRLHDLLRAYAGEAAESIARPERAQAIGRLLAAWLELLGQAVDRLPPSLFRPVPGRSPRLPLPAALTERLLVDARGWLDAEREGLLNAVRLAAEWELDEPAWELATTAVPYYDLRCHYEEWRRGHLLALRSVRAAGNARGEAALLRGTGQVNVYRDAYDQATEDYTAQWRLSQQIGDQRGVALGMAGLATVARVQGRYQEALDLDLRALDIVVSAADRHVEAQVRNGIASVLLAMGQEDQAAMWFGDALALASTLGDKHREAVVLRQLSTLHMRRGNPEEALSCLRAALRTFTELGDERCCGYTLLALGRVFVDQRDRVRGRSTLVRAADLFGRTGDRWNEAECWQLLGQLDAGNGDDTDAREYLLRARGLWRSVGATTRADGTTKILLNLAG